MNTALRTTSITLIAATLAAGFMARPALAADAAPAAVQLPTVVVLGKRHVEPSVQQWPTVVVSGRRSVETVAQQLPTVVVLGKRHVETAAVAAERAARVATVAVAEGN